MLTIRSVLFRISETLVDESKQHITAEQAVKKIREYLRQTNCSACKDFKEGEAMLLFLWKEQILTNEEYHNALARLLAKSKDSKSGT